MCGICGTIGLNGKYADKDKILAMMQRLKHRGPDDEGTFIYKNIGLGHVRLSIIDLSSAGHQPMFSDNGRYVIVFNGEIYNYLELKEELRTKYKFQTKSDTEVILAAYQEWGENCLDHFNGDWAFVIYDKLSNKIFGARDRYGIKPFYYKIDDNSFYFSSEIKALNTRNTKPNYSNIFDYLVFNRTDHNDNTFFETIFKLEHGSKFVIKNSEVSFSKWYNLAENIQHNKTINLKQCVDRFNELFSESIKIRLRSDVPLGVCLSGGLDSSAIVSTLLNSFNMSGPNTFSAIYPDFAEADESYFINLYSEQLSNMHYTHPNADTFLNDYLKFIDAQSEPVASIGPYAQYKVMELAQKHVKVTIDGQGADEQLGGYHYFFGAYYKELLYSLRLIKLIQENYYYLRKHKSIAAFKYFLYYMLPYSLKDFVGRKIYGNVSNEFFNEYHSSSEVGDKLYNPKSLMESLYQHFENKLEHLLKWEDHNSMYFSIESRVPFLDHRLVEFQLGLIPKYIINNGETKFILRESMKGILPEQIRTRVDKKGFSTPSDVWFRTNQFQELILNIINSKSFTERGIFNPIACKKAYQEHMDGTKLHTIDIWKWINLEIWFRNYID